MLASLLNCEESMKPTGTTSPYTLRKKRAMCEEISFLEEEVNSNSI